MFAIDSYMAAIASKPMPLPKPNADVLTDPRFLLATLTTATANDSVSLKTAAAYGDDYQLQVNYGTGIPECVHRFSSIYVWAYGNDWRDLDPSEKASVMKELHLIITRSGVSKKWRLGQHIIEGFTNTNELQAAAANQVTAECIGTVLDLDEPVEYDVVKDSISINTVSSIAHGGLTFYVVLDDCLTFPNTEQRQGGFVGALPWGRDCAHPIRARGESAEQARGRLVAIHQRATAVYNQLKKATRRVGRRSLAA